MSAEQIIQIVEIGAPLAAIVLLYALFPVIMRAASRLERRGARK